MFERCMHWCPRQLVTKRLTRVSVHSRASPWICKHRLLCMVALLLPRPTLDSNSTTLNLHDCPLYLVNFSHSFIIVLFFSPPIRSSVFVLFSRLCHVAFPLTSSFVAWRGVEERDGGGRGGPAGMGWKRKRGREVGEAIILYVQ